MISGITQSMDDALAILKTLLQGEEISTRKNADLYEKYKYSSETEEVLEYLTEKLELRIYLGNENLFICPIVGSKIFGWTNAELRDKVKYIKNNGQLFTGYFITMILITMFYREAYPDTPVAYVKVNDLVESVTKRFDTLYVMDDLESVSQENQFDFVGICKSWKDLADAREGVSGGSKDKIAFVENWCNFLGEEKLIVFDQNQRIIYPSERLKTIIWNYYEDRDNRKDLMSFINGLEGKI